MYRMLLIGAGRMARIRLAAFLNTNKVVLQGVCSKQISRAKGLAEANACSAFFDDYRIAIHTLKPDFVLVETPHDIQQRNC